MVIFKKNDRVKNALTQVMYLPTWPQIKHTGTYSHTHHPLSIPTFLSSLLKPTTEEKLKGISFTGVAHGSLCSQSF